jgi:N,N'-diacetyllegionaminate synthase
MVDGQLGKMSTKLFSGKIFIIAEMANSHEGNIAKAKEITELAAKAGADAIKYQKFTADELLEPGHKDYKLFKNLEMSIKEWSKLVNFAKSKKLKVFFDVFGVKSTKKLSKLRIDGYKIHASDLGNPQMLDLFSKMTKPLLISAAGAYLNEIEEALKRLQKKPKEIGIMYGFQGYPTSIKDTNLLNLLELRKRFDHTIGISDHTSGDSAMAQITPLLAIGLGATIVEKHLTLNRDDKGLDYYSALNPDEFKNLVSNIRMTEKILKKTGFRLQGNEIAYRRKHKKNALSAYTIKKGTILNEKMFNFKRTTKAADSLSYFDFIGRKAVKDIPKGSVLTDKFLGKPRKLAAIIACRVGSERLFAKPLQKVGDFSILELLISQLRRSKMLDDVVLAISENPGNEVFVDFAKEQKLKFVEGDDRDVLKRLIDGAKHVNADTVLRVTSENPFIYWEGIDQLVKKHIEGNFDLSTFREIPLGSSLEIIKLDALEKSHKYGTKRHRSELCTLYINENPNKFKICRLVPKKELRRPDLRLTVDTPQDLMVSRIIYDSLGRKNWPIKLENIVKFLDSHSEVKKINSDVPVEFRIF